MHGDHNHGSEHDISTTHDKPAYVLVRRDDFDNLARWLDDDQRTDALYDNARTLVNNVAGYDQPLYVHTDPTTDDATDDGPLWRLLLDTLEYDGTLGALRTAVAARYGS